MESFKETQVHDSTNPSIPTPSFVESPLFQGFWALYLHGARPGVRCPPRKPLSVRACVYQPGSGLEKHSEWVSK